MKYVSLKDGEKLLIKALLLAKELSHTVEVKNYDEGYMRDEGCPDYYDFGFESVIDGNAIDLDEMPYYEGNGCNDVVIRVRDGAELYEYNVWYSDNSEDRIYIDEIKNYLETYRSSPVITG